MDLQIPGMRSGGWSEWLGVMAPAMYSAWVVGTQALCPVQSVNFAAVPYCRAASVVHSSASAGAKGAPFFGCLLWCVQLLVPEWGHGSLGSSYPPCPPCIWLPSGHLVLPLGLRMRIGGKFANDVCWVGSSTVLCLLPRSLVSFQHP